MEHNFITWKLKEKPKLKKLHMESDSDDEQLEVPFSRFIILESREEVPLTKLSPFLIQRVISSIVNPKSVKKKKNLKIENILVEIQNKKMQACC